MEINRRDFVKLIGISLAGLAVGSGAGAVMNIPEKLLPVLYTGPKIENWKLTSCSKCPGGCSLRIRLIDNFPIQAFGNPLSPINGGGICPMGLTSVSDLYHPSRITSPLKKVNDKFVAITYTEAYSILIDNLRKVIAKNEQDDIFVIAQTESRIRESIFTEFSKATGINNLIIDNYKRNSISPYYNFAAEPPDFIDFDKCDYLLNFGTALSEISLNPIFYIKKLIEFREKGFRITNAGPKLVAPGSGLDEWIPVHPEAFGDLALGIAYVLLKDDEYDKNTETFISGFDSVKKYILDNYYPDNVEKLTGVPADTILQTGRKFEKAAAPAAYFDETILYASNGTENAHSIILLNALKGFRGYGKIKDDFYTSLINQGSPAAESVTINTLRKRLEAGKNDIRILMISGSNFIFNNADQESLKKQIKSIPFIVSFSPFTDETSCFADLVIPDHNDLEKFDLSFNESTGNTVITVQQPVVDPFFKTTDTGDVFISLMKDLKPENKFSYGSVSDYVKAIADKIYKNGDGTLMIQKKFTAIEKGLRKIGWKTDEYGGFDDFWDSFLEYGGWWNPFSEKKSYSAKINNKNGFTFGNKNIVPEKGSKNKLYMNIFRKNLDYKGSMSLFPVLVEQFGHNWSVFYELWMEINPETARSHSIRNRDKVYIKTAKGKFPAVVIYNPAVMPGNLDIPFGMGHKVLGDDSGINPLEFSDNVFDKVSGKSSFSGTIARIESASSGNHLFSAKVTDYKSGLSG